MQTVKNAIKKITYFGKKNLLNNVHQKISLSLLMTVERKGSHEINSKVHW